MRILSHCFRRWPVLACVLSVTGCAGSATQPTSRAEPVAAPVRFESAELCVTLSGVLGLGDPAGPVTDPGWREYLLEIENRGSRPLTVRNVKLLNRSGRYLDSAATYEEITAPPDAAYELAGTVAKSVAGQVAGQVIPYGGSIFGILSGAASISSANAQADAKRAFATRKLKNVELAPAGTVKGSAFLPETADRQALVIDYGIGDKTDRVEIPLAR
jgi:hypothetical protein